MKPRSISKICSSKPSRQKNPRVGIFWLLGGKLLIDSTSLNEAERYGIHLTHPRNHLEVWTWFQQGGTVPADIEYEEPPRGRVVYNRKTEAPFVHCHNALPTEPPKRLQLALSFPPPPAGEPVRQNSSFNANWMSLGLLIVLFTTPKLALLAVQQVPFGGPNCG
jgi:hypothetical protein